jgi:hypothetical protein
MLGRVYKAMTYHLSPTKATEIYLQVVGEEKRQLVLDAWED